MPPPPPIPWPRTTQNSRNPNNNLKQKSSGNDAHVPRYNLAAWRPHPYGRFVHVRDHQRRHADVPHQSGQRSGAPVMGDRPGVGQGQGDVSGSFILRIAGVFCTHVLSFIYTFWVHYYYYSFCCCFSFSFDIFKFHLPPLRFVVCAFCTQCVCLMGLLGYVDLVPIYWLLVAKHYCRPLTAASRHKMCVINESDSGFDCGLLCRQNGFALIG